MAHVRSPLFAPAFSTVFAVATLVAVAGCNDDIETIREIQAQRQARMQTQSNQDHLGEMVELLERLVELNPEKARQQIAYHINQWDEAHGGRGESSAAPPELLRTLSDVAPLEQLTDQVMRDEFTRADVDHLRDAYLFSQIVRWVDTPGHDDPVLAAWLADLTSRHDEEAVSQLRTATRLFDWTVRNVALEPVRLEVPPSVPVPTMPLGMQVGGPGYRQSDFQTVFRGSGDAWQRAGVFTQLCRQAQITAVVLAIQTDSGRLDPWAAAVLIDDELYLFEPGLGVFVPGPDQLGIATLQEARTDELVMRRLNVPGFFEYPLSKSDIQQCVALLNVVPEAISPRMRRLEAGLTGDRRMQLYVDGAAKAERLDAISGIAGVRFWDVPLLAIVYDAAAQRAAERDPRFGFWHTSRWAIMDADVEMSQLLSKGRWRHLQGRFDDDELEIEQGARTLYLEQRAPEFEIADLRIDVELQKRYNIRRELGMDPEIYDQQIRQIQVLMRLGKRTATYWLSLLQYDDGRYDTAENWFSKRALDENQRSHWEPAARYNLGRTYEMLGNADRAIELYKTSGDLQEHGNRIRARLVDRVNMALDAASDQANSD